MNIQKKDKVYNKKKLSALSISGVILAGGANIRFNGKTKAMIDIGGKPIISIIIGTIKDLFDELIIVTNTPELFDNISNCILVEDHFKMVGPLGGIHAALKAANGDAIFVFAGDMPLLSRNLITGQIEYYMENKTDVLIPRISQDIEPLHAIYSKSITPILEEYLENETDFAVWKFLKHINVGFLQLNDSDLIRQALTNINTPKDLAGFQKMPNLL